MPFCLLIPLPFSGTITALEGLWCALQRGSKYSSGKVAKVFWGTSTPGITMSEHDTFLLYAAVDFLSFRNRKFFSY